LVDVFNTMEGVSCNKAEGAMYLFPTVTIPEKAIEEAKRQGKTPDTFYSLEMLEKTGVVMVPGSGFGQKAGTHHFRTTFLPAEEKFDYFTDKLVKFHKEFMAKYQ
jgi:aspartate/methionine/tyrosine aminotransferase